MNRAGAVRAVGGAMLLAAVLSGLPLVSGCDTAGGSSRQYRTSPLARYRSTVPTVQERIIQAGERVRIELHTPVMPVPEMLERLLDEKGRVTLPYISIVEIGGMTPVRAAQVIRNKYVAENIYKEGSIHVTVLPQVSEFFVTGQINRPGTFQLTTKITALQAVAMAGGRNEFADKHKLKLIRKGKTFFIDGEKVSKGTEEDLFVEPGDTIEVPQSPW